MTEEKTEVRDLVVSSKTGAMVSFVPRQDVMILAARLWPLIEISNRSKTDKFRFNKAETYHVAEMSMAFGCNPLAIDREYYAYKDKMGRIIVQPHYGKDIAWASSKEPYDDMYYEWDAAKKEASEVVDVGDIVYDCILVPESKKKDFKEIYATVYSALIDKRDHFEADMLAMYAAGDKFGKIRSGRVEHEEVFDDRGKVKYGSAGKIKGWIPGHDRAKIRALRNAIKAYYGIPSPDEYRAMGYDMSNPDVAEAIAGMPEKIVLEPDYVQERYVELDQAYKQSVAGLSSGELRKKRQENVELMRGPELGDDWLDEEPVEEVLVSNDPVKDDITIGDVKNALLKLGHGDHATQMEYLARFGRGTSFSDLSNKQKEEIIKEANND